MNLLLIGYRGVGKTSVARWLGLKLGWPWVDVDVELELRAGKSIASIFADEGEPSFRDRESAVLADLAQARQTVIACGGGVVLRPENRRVLREAGRVVWLQAAPGTILDRVARDVTTAGRRPQLTTAGGADEVLQLLQQRLPLYQQCADLAVDTEQRSPEEIAQEIAHWLEHTPFSRETA